MNLTYHVKYGLSFLLRLVFFAYFKILLAGSMSQLGNDSNAPLYYQFLVRIEAFYHDQTYLSTQVLQIVVEPRRINPIPENTAAVANVY